MKNVKKLFERCTKYIVQKVSLHFFCNFASYKISRKMKKNHVQLSQEDSEQICSKERMKNVKKLFEHCT